MPIKPSHLQRRHAELGRIRLGYKADTSNGKTRPAKLERFRFTSVSEGYIRDLAALYGGEPRPWDNGGIASHEVYTEAATIPVIAVKGGLSQWLETWSGGGCVHRCDGENQVDGTPCDPNDRAHVDAKPTTRLSLMLPELDAIGVWRMETHGWNAAAEIPAVAELAQFVGDLVPAELHLVERRAIKDGKTSRFVVPVLDLKIGAARLREIVAEKSGQPLELAGSEDETPALGARPDAEDAYTPYFAKIAEAGTVDELQAIWHEMLTEKLVGQQSVESPRRAEFFAAFQSRGAEVKDAAPGQQASEDDVVDAEIVDDKSGDDADAVWQKILLAAGERGMTNPDLEDDFAKRMGGVTSAEASVAELQHYLGLLSNEQVPA